MLYSSGRRRTIFLSVTGVRACAHPIYETRLGQGRDKVKDLLHENPELCEEIAELVKARAVSAEHNAKSSKKGKKGVEAAAPTTAEEKAADNTKPLKMSSAAAEITPEEDNG